MFQNKEQASLYIFNVGQANLFIFKDKDNAFVFDCGFNLKVINIIPYSETINNILSGIKPTIIISHQDLDHFGCLNDFFPPQERKKVIIGGFPIAGKKYIGDDIYFVENQRNGKILNSKLEQLDFSIDELTQCKDIQFFFPENNKSKKNNHQSLIFKLEIYGRNILFPGDLDNTLLNKLIATRGYQEFFSNIDVFIFPHHGGNSNGELSLFALLNDESQSTVPVLSIISSDANKQNSIPTSIIFNLKFENSDSYIEKHSITVYSIYKKEVCTFEKKMALFVSSDAKSKYYEIIFNMNGTINLLDAGKRPLFSNIRDFSEEEIISQILKYYTIENSLYCKWLIQKLKTLLLQYHISEIASMLKFIIPRLTLELIFCKILNFLEITNKLKK